MLVSLLGTEYFPLIEDGILYVEDVNEHPYRVERMLLQLMQAGVLARQKALVLGDFSGLPAQSRRPRLRLRRHAGLPARARCRCRC